MIVKRGGYLYPPLFVQRRDIMDEREWQTFLSVVDEGNITKAAEKLFISQPALSYRIRQLESTIGHSLLLRTTDGIALTPQGEIYYKYCKKMIQYSEDICIRLEKKPLSP